MRANVFIPRLWLRRNKCFLMAYGFGIVKPIEPRRREKQRALHQRIDGERQRANVNRSIETSSSRTKMRRTCCFS